MKKFVLFLLTVMIAFSAFGASAASVPNFMKHPYTNYTADYSLTMSFESSEEFVALLDEIEMPDEISNFIDVKALLESLFKADSKVNIQADVSEDFRRIDMAMTSETERSLVLNQNFDGIYNLRTGMWFHMDIDKEELKMVYSTPFTNKYAVMDFSEDVPEEVKAEIFDVYDKMFNKEFVDSLKKDITEISVKYADISMKGSECTIKYDNDAFTAMLDELMDYMVNYIGNITSDMTGEEITGFDVPSLKGIRFLGKDGVTSTYRLSGTKIASARETWDVSVSIADIYTRITGLEWPYESEGNIDIKIETDMNVTKIGTTHVTMPVLNDENSFSVFSDLFGAGYDEYTYEEDWDAPYVSYYVWGYTDTDTFDGERYYMPLRQCIEDCYYNCSEITYDNGYVTISAGCDGDITNITLRVGEDTAVADGMVYTDLGEFKLIDGSVYASVDFYEKCLGWSLENLNKDLLYGGLDYGFYTDASWEY